MKSPDRLDSGALETAVPRNKWQSKVERSRSDDVVGHIRNDVSRNAPQDARNMGIQWNNGERGIVLAEFSSKPLECIGGNAPAFYEVHNLNERDRGHMRWRAAGRCGVNQRKNCLREILRVEQVPNGRMRIEDRSHQEMSRGKLPHISRRASAMSSSVMLLWKSF